MDRDLSGAASSRRPRGARAGAAAISGPALAAALLLAATAALYAVSRGRWSDAIIDSGTEWIYADSLARGELLYRDVIYWFGPITPYFQAAFLRLFGSSFTALAISGIAGSIAALAALNVALRRVALRREAWIVTALAIPALVFMPNAGGSIIGMGYRIWHPATFALLAIAAAARKGGRPPASGAVAAGLLCGLASLCRTEWGLMALAGVGTVFVLSRDKPLEAAKPVVLASLAAIFAFAAGIGVFVVAAGPGPVLGDGHILLGGVSQETREFLVAFSGVRDWRLGLAELFYSAAMWSGAILLATWAGLRQGLRPGRRMGAALAAVVGALALAALSGGARGAVLFSAAPVLCAAAIVAGVWRRGRPRTAALAAFGLVGFLASHRRPFHIGDSAYVAPPMLFAFVCLAGLLALAAAMPASGAVRRRLRLAYSAGLAMLVVCAFAGRVLQYAGQDVVPVPGTGGMLSASATRAREIASAADAVRRATEPGDALVVIPEGQVLNEITGRRNPLRQKLYIPGYLTDENEAAVLEDFVRRRPRAIVIWYRPTSEYGPSLFGHGYGMRVMSWIRENYAAPVPTMPRSLNRLYLLRRPADPAAPANGPPR